MNAYILCGHFWPGDKDGGHTIQSTMGENHMLHANFMALCFIELELLLSFFAILTAFLIIFFLRGNMHF